MLLRTGPLKRNRSISNELELHSCPQTNGFQRARLFEVTMKKSHGNK